MQFLFILKSLLQVSKISKNFLPGPLQNHQNHNIFLGPLLSYMVLTKTSWQPCGRGLPDYWEHKFSIITWSAHIYFKPHWLFPYLTWDFELVLGSNWHIGNDKTTTFHIKLSVSSVVTLNFINWPMSRVAGQDE